MILRSSKSYKMWTSHTDLEILMNFELNKAIKLSEVYDIEKIESSSYVSDESVENEFLSEFDKFTNLNSKTEVSQSHSAK